MEVPRDPAADDPTPDLLTLRERRIVLALCDGLDRNAIAARIGCSRSTLNKALSDLYAATGFQRAHQLVAWAVRCGLGPDTSAALRGFLSVGHDDGRS